VRRADSLEILGASTSWIPKGVSCLYRDYSVRVDNHWLMLALGVNSRNMRLVCQIIAIILCPFIAIVVYKPVRGKQCVP